MIQEWDLLASVTKKLIREKALYFDPQVRWISREYHGIHDELAGECYEYVVLEKGPQESIEILKSTQAHHDGVFIRGHDERISLGYIEGTGVIISDRFAGCDFQFLVSSFGTLGAHVYSNQKCRQVMEDLPLYDWDFKLKYESAGKARSAVMDGVKRPTGDLLGFAFVQGLSVNVYWVNVDRAGTILDCTLEQKPSDMKR